MAIDGNVDFGDADNTGIDQTPLTLSGTSEIGAALASDGNTWPLLALDGGLDGPLPLPAWTLEATGTAGTLAYGESMSWPARTLDAGTDDGRTLALPTLSAAGLAGGAGAGLLSWPTLALDGALDGPLALGDWTLDASGLAGALADGLLTLPLWESSGEVGPQGELPLPALALDAAALAGTVGTGAALLAGASLDAQLWTEGQGSGSITLALLDLQAALGAASVIDGSVTLDAASLAGAGAAGVIGLAELTLPLASLEAGGHVSVTGVAHLTLPILSLGAAVIGGTLAGGADLSQPRAIPTVSALALQTRLQAVTRYTNSGFNSYARLGEVVLAAGPTGIFALEGDTDLEQPIAARVAGGVSDWGEVQTKRVLGAYVGLRADGMLDLTLITDEHHEYLYRLVPRNLDVLHPARVKTGRGIDGRYWQWQLDNVDGADFTVESLALEVQPLGRRL